MNRLVTIITLATLLLIGCGRTDTGQIRPTETPAPTLTQTALPYPTHTPTLTATQPPIPTWTPTTQPGPTAMPTIDPAMAAELTTRIYTAQQAWQNSQIASYRLTVLEIHSIWSAQRITITVTDGHVSDIQSMCIPAPSQGSTCTIQAVEPANYVVPKLLAQAKELANRYRPEYLQLSFDPVLGYPTMMSYDDPQILDEDYGLKVEKFEQLPGRPASELGEAVTLRVGEKAQAAGVTVELVRIIEDSRCPSSVNCVWSGQVVVELLVTAPNAKPESVQLKLLGTGMQLGEPTSVGNKHIQLTSVSPYPGTPDAIPTQNYSITLQIT